MAFVLIVFGAASGTEPGDHHNGHDLYILVSIHHHALVEELQGGLSIPPREVVSNQRTGAVHDGLHIGRQVHPLPCYKPLALGPHHLKP